METATQNMIAEKVRENLASRGIDRAAAAEALDVSEQAVAIQLDCLPFNEKTAIMYSEAFGFSPKFLLSGEGELMSQQPDELEPEEGALTKSEMMAMIMEHLHIRTNADFAKFLGFSPQRSHSWMRRNVFNAELLIRKCPELSGDWLLTGKGEMLKKDRFPQNNGADFEKLVLMLKEQQEIASRAQKQVDKMMNIMTTAFSTKNH